MSGETKSIAKRFLDWLARPPWWTTRRSAYDEWPPVMGPVRVVTLVPGNMAKPARPPRVSRKRGKLAPRGQCEYCDRRRVADAARLARHREREERFP